MPAPRTTKKDKLKFLKYRKHLWGHLPLHFGKYSETDKINLRQIAQDMVRAGLYSVSTSLGDLDVPIIKLINELTQAKSKK